eukprot:g16330.t1
MPQQQLEMKRSREGRRPWGGVQEDDTTDIEDATATNIQDLPAYVAPPTSDIAPPTTASSSRGDNSTQSCRVFTIPPDLPLTEDE